MRILTATLSIVFLLLWIVLAASLKPWEMVDEIESAPTNAVVAFCLFSFFIWVFFRVLDRLYRHVHPAAYETLWSMNSNDHGLTLTQAFVSALRTSVQCVAIPSVSLSVLLLASVPLLVVSSKGSGAGVAYFWSATIAMMLFVMVVLGWLVQLSYGRGVLHLMQQNSATAEGDKSDAHGDDDEQSNSQSKPLQFHAYDAAAPVPTSSRGGEMLRAARRVGRLVRLRDIGAPVAAMAGSIAAAYMLAPDKRDTWIGIYLVLWVVLFAIAWCTSSFRLYDRTPLRQLRLGIGLCLHAFLVLCAVPFVLLFEMSGRSGRPVEQWTIVRVTGQWINSLLRSSRLFWIPATLVAALTLHGLDTGKEAMSSILISFCAGIIAFEITYRTLDRLVRSRQLGSNSLVFLRVFGDRRRGRFLFSQIAPRWRGLGTITGIAAPDVSLHQLETDVGFEILFGRLRQRFLRGHAAGVFGRHLNSESPGVVREDHCFDDTWKAAVRSMFAQNAIVLMDLRGFGPERQGCIYELGVLRDCIPMRCVVFLIDHTTDFTFLKNTLQRLWNTMAVSSPNATESGSQATGQLTATNSLQEQVTVFRLSDSESESANQLTLLLVEACVAGEQYNQHGGQIALQQLVGDLRLLAAPATEQIAAVGAGGSPWKLVLNAGDSCDPDLDTPGHLLASGLITEQQRHATNVVHEAVQEIRCTSSLQTADAMQIDPAWQGLRTVAQSCLNALGK